MNAPCIAAALICSMYSYLDHGNITLCGRELLLIAALCQCCHNFVHRTHMSVRAVLEDVHVAQV